MPEGHTIHRLARNLFASLTPEPVRATSPQGRFSNGASIIDGQRLVATSAWGKYLFVEWADGQVLHVHLGLIGKFRRVALATAQRPSIRLRLVGSTHAWDLTGPTRCELITPDERSAIEAKLGADPLRDRPNVAAARATFATSGRSVGALLLDQTVIAGIGNVYRAELLFVCGINPQRPARTLSDQEFEKLWSETVRLLRIGVRMGRIVTTDPTEIGRPRSRMHADDRLYVYHRDRCRRCGTELRTVELGGRPLQFCPTCQPS